MSVYDRSFSTHRNQYCSQSCHYCVKIKLDKWPTKTKGWKPNFDRWVRWGSSAGISKAVFISILSLICYSIILSFPQQGALTSNCNSIQLSSIQWGLFFITKCIQDYRFKGLILMCLHEIINKQLLIAKNCKTLIAREVMRSQM